MTRAKVKSWSWYLPGRRIVLCCQECGTMWTIVNTSVLASFFCPHCGWEIDFTEDVVERG